LYPRFSIFIGFSFYLDIDQFASYQIFCCDVRLELVSIDGGYTAARMLVQLANPPTAIYAASGGHDDLAYPRHIWPGLTTIHQPAEEILEQAHGLQIDLLKGASVSKIQVILPPHLVVRGSTGHCREAMMK
jgi:DNA-binding LacI/PurR family transcriptional regulator